MLIDHNGEIFCFYCDIEYYTDATIHIFPEFDPTSCLLATVYKWQDYRYQINTGGRIEYMGYTYIPYISHCKYLSPKQFASILIQRLITHPECLTTLDRDVLKALVAYDKTRH